MSVKQPADHPGKARGFALGLVIVLLGLLVLAAYALALLGRIESQSAAVAEHRLRARQHALAALRLAVASLQEHAGSDDVITGMAGISGVSAGAGNPSRQWTGVWGRAGGAPLWLVSGAAANPVGKLEATNSVLLVGVGTVGTDAVEREHVRVPWIFADDDAGDGRLAWWVGDGGVKLSARFREGSVGHALDLYFPGLDPESPELDRLQVYGQLAFVPGAGISAEQLRAHAHVVSVVHQAVDLGTGSPRLSAGKLNVNSDSARYWQGIAATYNRMSPSDERLGVTPETFGARLNRGFVEAADAGKLRAGPFINVEAFFSSRLLAQALDGSGVDPQQFRERLLGLLVTRSDTFIVRAYGDSLNPTDRAAVESAAWCEATVQRTIEPMPGFGRRFVVRSFRWLGPDDL